MIIIETCPKCGHDLIDTVIDTYPPIPRKDCPACGWFWEGALKPEEIVRIPFDEGFAAAVDLTTDTVVKVNGIGRPYYATADEIKSVPTDLVDKR